MKKYEQASLNKMKEVPFTKGCSGFIKSGAALFFTNVFDKLNHKKANKAYESLEKVAEVRKGRWCSGSCSNNIMQAFVTHPERKKSGIMRGVVRYLATQQKDNGSWAGSTPFYPTVYALSLLDFSEVEPQLDRAVQKVIKYQNKDGSWGRANKELNTFLMIKVLSDRFGIL